MEAAGKTILYHRMNRLRHDDYIYAYENNFVLFVSFVVNRFSQAN